MECQFACRAVLGSPVGNHTETHCSSKGSSEPKGKSRDEVDSDREVTEEEKTEEKTTASDRRSAILEWLMKGKWHAKITLSKLLRVEPETERTRLDFVSEKLFDDCLFFASHNIGSNKSLGLVSSPSAWKRY